MKNTPSITLVPPPAMSVKEAIPCAVCQSPGEPSGDFGDYLQCTNPKCSQSAFQIHETLWPHVMSEAEKAQAALEAEE